MSRSEGRLMGRAMKVLPRSFYRRPVLEVAPEMLGKVLWRRTPAGVLAGRIVEVEAYDGANDPASHAFRGQTPRTQVMFGPGGHLYVYFTYGMHWCCNAVCGTKGEASAVLVRALSPMRGVETMRRLRSLTRRSRKKRSGRPLADRLLCSGPARLCQALEIDGEANGADLVRMNQGIAIKDDGTPPPRSPAVGPRVGISKAEDYPWRFWIDGDPNVS